MGRFARPALGGLAGLMALGGVVVAADRASAQSGPPAASAVPGAPLAGPGSGSAPAAGTAPGQADGQPAAGTDRQGSAGPEDGQPVPGCPARRNKLELIV